MFWRLVLIFILLPALDLLGLLFCSNMFGVLGFIFMVIAIIGSGLLGAFLARYQGLRCWIEFNRQLDRRESPTTTVLHGILIFLAAIFLIFPGLLTDFLGLMLLIPPIRSLLISYIRLRFEAYRTQTNNRHQKHQPNQNDIINDIIDVDVE
ncbi:MAG: FxsA family protein [Planctomycetaceae bacterium]|nr:FxsA family protein [Planctomycetaceae bacterium]